MANLQDIQTSFAWGEVSPKMLSRVDLEQYGKATKTMLNAYPFVQGGCTRRQGTTFVGEVYNSARPVRLIPFTYSTSLSYILVFNGGKIEFINNAGDFITSGGPHYQLAHTYADDELASLTYAQVGNTLFIAHKNHKPLQIQRSSETVWVSTDIPVATLAVTDYWYENYRIAFKILGGTTAFVKTNSYTITVAAGVGTLSALGGPAGANGTVAQITVAAGAPNETWTLTCTYADSTRQKWTVVGSVSGTCAATWSASNYPAAVAFYNQRLYLAGSTTEPQAIWGSSITDYTDFTRGANDDDAFKFTIASNNYDAILHLTTARSLLPLSYSGEYSMSGSANTGITPSSVKILPQTFHGTGSVRPIRIGTEVIFCQKDLKKLRAISYSVTEDANIAPDITLVADHITEAGIVDMTFAQDPDFIAWVVRSDGALLSLTLAREYQTIAWAKHTTDGLFENVSTLISSGADQVFFVVKRTINGATKRYIEQFDYTAGLYADCGLTYTGSPGVKATVFTGLSHLEGKTVDVVGDGFVVPPVVVTSGQITLPVAVNKIAVGLHYDTTIEVLHPEMGDGSKQSSQDHAFSPYAIYLHFLNTVNCRVNGYQVPFRTNTGGLDTVIPPFTGVKTASAYGWRTPYNLKIEQVTPMPFTLLSTTLKATVNE